MSCTQVVPSLQASNTVTNAQQWKKHTQLMPWDRDYISVHIAMLLALPKGDFYREAEDIHN
jgi:hypothetical protein